MKIVVTDGFTLNPGDLNWGAFRQFGEVTVYDRTNPEELIERIQDAEAVLTNKVVLDAKIMDRCRNMKYIGVLATGYNIIDVKAARDRGIAVTNVPTYGTASVGQFAIGLLLEICHHIGHHSQRVHEGAWGNCPDWCFWDYTQIELADKTMGVIGFGRIGQTTGRVAKALGMRILACDQYPTESGKEVAEYVDKDFLFANSDVIVLHCPLFPDTEGMINAESIAKMKDGVIIINNSRGQLVNEYDLAAALNSGKVAAAGVDVVSTEPIEPDNPLLTAKNCLITPHISWAPKESRQRMMDIAAKNLHSYLKGELENRV